LRISTRAQAPADASGRRHAHLVAPEVIFFLLAKLFFSKAQKHDSNVKKSLEAKKFKPTKKKGKRALFFGPGHFIFFSARLKFKKQKTWPSTAVTGSLPKYGAPPRGTCCA
jgi:hypothetical protein